MQVDNNYNNYNNYKVNFGAKRIMSTSKMVDGLCEKFEVYKLEKSDIPFVRKLITYMDMQKRKLDENQKKILGQLKEFVKPRNFGYFEEPGLFSRGDYKKLYIGIKNDEQISGLMQTNSSASVGGKVHKIDEICQNVEDKVLEDTFLYAFFADKKLKGDTRSIFGTKFFTGKVYDDIAIRKQIRERNPEFDFQVIPQNESFNLEDVLGITQ